MEKVYFAENEIGILDDAPWSKDYKGTRKYSDWYRATSYQR